MFSTMYMDRSCADIISSCVVFIYPSFSIRTRPDSSSRRTIAATYRRRPTPCSHTSTAQRGYLAAIATQLLRRYSATRCSVTA